MKKKDIAGTKWTWVCMDNYNKLAIAYHVGDRTEESAQNMVADAAWRIKTKRLQISSDGLPAYIESIHRNFKCIVDYVQIVKTYSNGKEKTTDNVSTKKGMKFLSSEKEVIFGEPRIKYHTTNYLERMNLTMRMQCKRFTRKTNAYSKKLLNHKYAVALNYFYYNFIRPHKTLGTTPAVHAGLLKIRLTIQDLVRMAENSIYSSNPVLHKLRH